MQSKYVAWLFAVEVLQTLYRWAVARGMYPSVVAATGIVAIAIGLSVPATLQHFIYWRNPDHYFGNGKPFGKQLQNYDAETLAVIDFLTKDAQPGDVVLCGDELLAPVLALTKCRVPFGYFAYAAGCTKRLHAKGDCGKEILERLAVRKGSRGLVARDGSSLHRREKDNRRSSGHDSGHYLKGVRKFRVLCLQGGPAAT